ncbi:MAG: TIGR02757 family protein [Alphaproteobacteria bacterium]|nr:TIGR02757 family protein [Alphaproteobacteria bacterium]
MSLKADLDAMVEALDVPGRLANDPVRFAHRYTAPVDQEIAAFLASGLAYGRVALFSPVIATLLDRADAQGGPEAWVRGFDAERELPVLEPLYYRWNRGPDHVALLDGLRILLGADGRLGDHVRMEPGETDVGPALSRFVRAIRAAVSTSEAGPGDWSRASRGLRYLLPDPADGSTAKRMAMLARWMVRTDGVDLGLWTHIPPSALVVPVDTHVHRIARLVGLSDRKTADWRTAVELTRALARFAPSDPVRYDFALAHLGISDGCSGSHQVTVCPTCPLRRHCVAATVTDLA